jgi:hypothetical protein
MTDATRRPPAELPVQLSQIREVLFLQRDDFHSFIPFR